MTEQSALYRWFWDKMNKATEVRPLTPERAAQIKTERSSENFREMRKNIETLNSFLGDANTVADDLEKAGVDVERAKNFIRSLSGPVNILNNVTAASMEAVEAAEAVRLQLATWYHEAERADREAAGGDDDQYAILSAALVRQWAGRNVKGVLGSQKDSFVQRLWPKWRDRILKLIV